MLAAPQFRIILALCAATCMWLYARPFLEPYVTGTHYSEQVAGGPLGDLYPSWFGTRELVLNHLSPYGKEVTQSLQVAYYGHILDAGDRRNQQRFAYPIYIVFLFAATIWMPFQLVQMLGFWVLALITAASVPLWLRALRWKTTWPTMVCLQILMLSNIAVVHGLELQQLSLLVSAVTAAATLLLVRRKFLAGGCLFALAMIKPQLLSLPILWLLVWSLSNWPERKRFVIGFAATLATLIAAGELILPGWIGQFIHGALAYTQYAHPTSLLELLLGDRGLIIGGIMLALILARVCFVFRSVPPESPGFGLIFALVLASNLLMMPLMSPYNQALLLPGVLILLRSGQHTWVERWLWTLTIIALAWPWITAALLVALSWLHSPPAQTWIDIPLYSTVVLPMMVTAMLICQAVRRPATSTS